MFFGGNNLLILNQGLLIYFCVVSLKRILTWSRIRWTFSLHDSCCPILVSAQFLYAFHNFYVQRLFFHLVELIQSWSLSRICQLRYFWKVLTWVMAVLQLSINVTSRPIWKWTTSNWCNFLIWYLIKMWPFMSLWCGNLLSTM